VVDLEMEKFTPSLIQLVQRKIDILVQTHELLSMYGIKLGAAKLRTDFGRRKFLMTADQIQAEMNRFTIELLSPDTNTATNIITAPIFVDSGSPLLEDFNRFREVTVALGDLQDSLNPYTLTHPSFESLYEKRLVDFRVSYRLENCAEAGDIPLEITHLGINQFDISKRQSDPPHYMMIEPQSFLLKFLSGGMQFPPTPGSPMSSVYRNFERDFYDARLLLGYDSTRIEFPWFGRSINGLWKISLPSHKLPVCHGEETPLQGLSFWIWFTGKAR
jgi:hypothetical protein